MTAPTPGPLSDRDAAIVELPAAGLSHRRIAAELGGSGALSVEAFVLPAPASRPTSEHPFALVTWERVGGPMTWPPSYYASRAIAELAGRAGGQQYSVVDVTKKARSRPDIGEVLRPGRGVEDVPEAGSPTMASPDRKWRS